MIRQMIFRGLAAILGILAGLVAVWVPLTAIVTWTDEARVDCQNCRGFSLVELSEARS
jgi:hypothetical protein